MQKLLRGTLGFLLALLATYVVATAAATQSVMASLAEMGVSVPLGDRLATTFADQLGMFATHAPLLFVALGVGFSIAALVCRWLPDWRLAGYVCAGFVGIAVMHLMMRSLLDLTPVAATRTGLGLCVQGLAGALGGYVFYLVTSGAGSAEPEP